MEILYHLEEGTVGWEHRCDIAQASRGELLWHYFPSSVGMRAGNSVWESGFTWVPVLHFGLSMLQIYETLVIGAEEVDTHYGFTEGDESLWFRRRGKVVTVRPSFGSATISCSLVELRLATKAFVLKVVSDLSSVYPVLASTGVGLELTAKAETL
jgi:hypothetical protein